MRKRKLLQRILHISLVMTILLTGCAGNTNTIPNNEPTPSITAEQPTPSPVPTTEPSPTPKPTKAPTPTPTSTPTPTPYVEPTRVPAPEGASPEVAALYTYEWPEEMHLYEAYKDDFYIGTVYNSNYEAGKIYTTLVQNFNIITPENLMKPENMQPTEGNFSFGAANKMLAFAYNNNLLVHGHTLAWHNQSGNWLGKNVDRDTAIEQLRSHITNVVSEFKGKVYSWDVLNEAINDGVSLPADGDWTKCLRKTQWLNSIGPEYVAMAFRFAHEADPDAVLYYNDYNLNNTQKAKVAAAMVADLRAQGVPIHGIGMQGHYSVDVSINNVEINLKRFVDLGVKVSITELDLGVNGAKSTGLTQYQEDKQAIAYAKLFQMFKKYSDSIERVTFWGHIDSHSWRSENFPLLYNKDFTAKKALKAVYNPEAYLAQTGNLIAAASDTKTETMKLEAKYGEPKIDGSIDDIWADAKEYEVKSQLMAWQGATGTVRVLWGDKNIYVLMNVKDSVLNKAAESSHEQDTVEIFLDQGHEKGSSYDENDGQYRVRYDGEKSFGETPTEVGFICVDKRTTKNYLVEATIPLINEAKAGDVLGFEVQINDANADGIRQSVAKLSDLTSDSYMNTENWADIELVK